MSEVGTTLRIRLPNDFCVEDTTILAQPNEGALTLEQWAEIARPFILKTAIEATRSNALFSMLEANYKPEPPTFRERVAIYLRRIRDGWLVMTGKANISGDYW